MINGLGRPFARLWGVTAAANLGDGLLVAGLPVLLTTITTSPSAAAALQVALMGPMLLLALPAGILADRVGPRGVLLVVNLLRAGVLAVLCILIMWQGLTLAVIYLAAVAFGAGEVLVDTTAETAVPGVVARADVGRAHSRLIGTQMVGNNAVGAPIGAVLAVASGGLALGMPGLLFGLAALVARGLPARAPAHPSGTRSDARTAWREELTLGAKVVRRDGLLLRMAAASAVMNVGNNAFFGVLVLLVIGPIGLPASAYGVLLAVLAAGGVVGAAIADRVHRWLGYRRTLIGAAALTGLGMVLLGTARGPVMAGVGMVGLALPGMVWNVTTRVVRQVHLPVAVLGRVSSVVRTIALCATPAGAILGGAVAEAHGVAAVTWVALATAVVATGLLASIPARLVPPVGGHPATDDPEDTRSDRRAASAT